MRSTQRHHMEKYYTDGQKKNSNRCYDKRFSKTVCSKTNFGLWQTWCCEELIFAKKHPRPLFTSASSYGDCKEHELVEAKLCLLLSICQFTFLLFFSRFQEFRHSLLRNRDRRVHALRRLLKRPDEEARCRGLPSPSATRLPWLVLRGDEKVLVAAADCKTAVQKHFVRIDAAEVKTGKVRRLFRVFFSNFPSCQTN